MNRVAGVRTLHPERLTDRALGYQFAGFDELRLGSVLAADLQHAPGFLDVLGDDAGFLDAMRHRLLQVDIFAGFESIHSHAEMPMVRGGDEHGIEIGAGQEIVIIVIHVFLGEAEEVAGALFAFGVEIADADDLHAAGGVGVLLDHLDVTETHPADADDAEVDAIVGAKDARSGRPCGAQQGESSGGDSQKIPASIHEAIVEQDISRRDAENAEKP